MAFYQYTAEGHTLVRTLKSAREKTKVVNGEIIEIEDGIYEAGRLMLAGFEQIEDGAELLVNTIVEGAKDIVETLTGSDETAPETPAVEVTTEVTDDGSKDITIEVVTDTQETSPESEESKTSDETAPATDEPKVDGSEGTDLGAESNASAPTGDETAPETTKITPTKKTK